MPIAQSLAELNASAAQCDNLIANAHAAGPLTARDREQITVAAFLNLFIAWEEFVESAVLDYMMGDATVGGVVPARYVVPPSREHSNKMLIHTGRYFDYASYDNVRKVAKLYFDAGYPFEVPMSSINAPLSDMRTIRNACAHLSSTTVTALDILAIRIFGQPQPGVNVYTLLTAIDPRVPGGATTVYAGYRDTLLAAATLIANG